MQIVPVIDVRGGQVVRAVGGDRSAYEPLESDLCPTADPYPFAYALRERLACKEVYVADLDAIADGKPDLELVGGLVEMGFLTWVDAGVGDAADAVRLRQLGAAVVAGSETVHGPEAWERIVRAVDGRRMAFSLDLRNGQPIAPHWRGSPTAMQLIDEVAEIADEVSGEGLTRLFVIDVNRVGQKDGFGNDSLLRHLVQRLPACDIFVGGGVRGPGDVRRLHELGIAGALVSTAIHEGRLHPGDQS